LKRRINIVFNKRNVIAVDPSTVSVREAAKSTPR
jgi:hypothetical protein